MMWCGRRVVVMWCGRRVMVTVVGCDGGGVVW